MVHTISLPGLNGLLPPVLARSAMGWLAELGLTGPFTALPMYERQGVAGYAIIDDQQVYALKHYPHTPGLKRSPFLVEKMFYELAARCPGVCTPAPLGWEEDLRLGCIRMPKATGCPSPRMNVPEIAACLAFLTVLNRARADAAGRGWPVAPGARFSLNHHWAHLTRLIARLEKPARQLRTLASLLTEELEPAWQVLQVASARQCAKYRLDSARTLPLAERCLSPGGWALHHPGSDEEGHWYFMNFEDAGWDDPAWVCAELFRPGGPAPFEYFQSFATNLARSLGQGDAMVHRAMVLLPLAHLRQALEANVEAVEKPGQTKSSCSAIRRAVRDLAKMETWKLP